MLGLKRKDIALEPGRPCKTPLSTGALAIEFSKNTSAVGQGEDDWTDGIHAPALKKSIEDKLLEMEIYG